MNALALQLSVLDDLLERRLPPERLEVLAAARLALDVLPSDDLPWLALFREADGRLPGAVPVLSEREQPLALAHGCGLLAVLTVPELLRGILLVGGAERLGTARLEPRVRRLWEEGARDGAVRIGIVRWLAQLPGALRWLPLALDCARAGERPEFEALACENPYPMSHFPLPDALALVDRARRTGLALTRIEGLESRLHRASDLLDGLGDEVEASQGQALLVDSLSGE